MATWSLVIFYPGYAGAALIWGGTGFVQFQPANLPTDLERRGWVSSQQLISYARIIISTLCRYLIEFYNIIGYERYKTLRTK